MIEMVPKFGSSIPKKWAMAGMFTATVVLSLIIECLDRLPVVHPTPWWVWVMVAANFALIFTALGFVTIASRNMVQQIVNSVIMIGTLVLLLALYPIVL